MDFNHHHYGEEYSPIFQSSDSLGDRVLSPHMLVMVGEEPWSRQVVTYALQRAVRMGTSTHFLSILTTQTVWSMSDIMAFAALDVSTVATYNQHELAWAAAVAEDTNVFYTTRLSWGNIPSTMRHTAKTAGCTLIVMGPHLQTGCEPLSGKYMAHRVAMHARQPVLVVPPSGDASGAYGAWQRLLVVIDGSAAADVALEHALLLAQEERTTLCILQVLPPGRQAAAHVRAAGALAEAQTATSGVAYDMCQAQGNVTMAVLHTAAAQQCDVIILGVPTGNMWSRLLWGLPIKSILGRTTLPILLIPSA
jgi:nucleotide-binding universal stress UspA family protein